MAAIFVVIIVGLLQADADGVIRGCCGEIRGTVVDTSHQPVGGVEVQAREPNGRTLQLMTTAGDGTYRFRDLPANRYCLKVVGPGFYPTEIRDVLVEEDEVTVLGAAPLEVAPIEANCWSRRPDYFRPVNVATGEGAVAGTVVDGKRRPIEGATVTLNLQGKGRVAVQRTSNDGTFLIGGIGVRPGEYRLSITHEGFFIEEVEQLKFRPGLEAVYDPITMEACGKGRCQPHLKAHRVCGGP